MISCRLLLPSVEPSLGSSVLLLHRKGGDNTVWEGFAQQLAGAGYLVAMPVLPRALESDASVQSTLGALQGLWRDLQHPAAPGAEAPPSSPVNPGLGVVIGEGFGASLALELARTEETVGAAVLLSPALVDSGLDALERMRGFDRCPVLLVAGEDDTASSTAAMQLKGAAPAFCEVRLYSGSARGADLFAIRPAAMTQILDWLGQILGDARKGV